MNKNKLLIILIALLLASNLFLLFLLVQRPPFGKDGRRPERSSMMRQFLANDIGFDSQQLQQFDTLRTLHMEKMKSLLDTLSSTKQQLFSFRQPLAPAQRDSLLQTIGRYQMYIDAQMRLHLEEVRQLCTHKQQEAWDTLIDKVTRRLSGPGRREKEKDGGLRK